MLSIRETRIKDNEEKIKKMKDSNKYSEIANVDDDKL